MNQATINKLNAINRQFYSVTAAEFDQTRAIAWQGWQPLLPYIETGDDTPLNVLDVGCGNGRFGAFLAENLKHAIHYHGIDNNDKLLGLAHEALRAFPTMTTRIEPHDIVENPLNEGLYDLVVLFGVIHHVPGFEQRQQLMKALAERVTPGGLLVFAAWRFYEFDRFKKRIARWDDDLVDKVEKHDYLLDWRRGDIALRYCHYVDDDEHQALIQASGLTEIQTYRADGFTGTVNQYSILKNERAT